MGSTGLPPFHWKEPQRGSVAVATSSGHREEDSILVLNKLTA